MKSEICFRLSAFITVQLGFHSATIVETMTSLIAYHIPLSWCCSDHSVAHMQGLEPWSLHEKCLLLHIYVNQINRIIQKIMITSTQLTYIHASHKNLHKELLQIQLTLGSNQKLLDYYYTQYHKGSG